jgi:TetR/AcrR family transcriptional repressor of lmrAB and yxaGH operons
MTTKTTKGERTRERLVEAAATLLQRQGYHATGLLDVVAESGAPRGSLYFHFKGGKEELACAALEGAGTRWREVIEAIVNATPDPGEAIAAVCTFLGQALEASKFTEGCPLATVGLEASSTSEPVRQTIARHYDGWLATIAARGVALGVPEEEANRFATFTLSAIEGALLLSKVKKTTQPLKDVALVLRGLAAASLRASSG